MSVDAAGIEGAARAALAAGDESSACGLIETWLEAHPECYAQRCLLAFIHQQCGRFAAARVAYEAAQSVAPPSHELAQNLGLVYVRLGEVDRARSAFEAALRIDPEALDSLAALASVHQAQGDLPAALTCYERLLRRDPQYAAAHVGMAEAFADRGWDADAERSLETVLSFAPDNVPALNLLGVLRLRHGRHVEAAQLFEQAVRARPDDAGLLRNLAMVRAAAGDHAACGLLCRQALALAPEDPDVHFTLASHLLLTGQLAEGWRAYEYRWQSGERGRAVKPPPTKLPRWAGETVERVNSALVVYSEQGFGDGIQFARYLPLLTERFARLVFVTKAPLRALFARSFPGVEVLDTPPDEAALTHHCPLMSLPLAFATTLETIPAAVPYLQPDRVVVSAWQARLDSLPGLRVGVNWTTGKRAVHKSSFEPLLRELAALLAVPAVSWVCLSKEPLSAEDSVCLAAAGVHDWSDELTDFDATAALVNGLDLVISVDTAVAHLAGALARPVWLLNRAESEWRWLLDRDDSPWYPTMRIFRQQQARDWSAPLEAVRLALAERLAGCSR